mgnify:CR=1 FL=1
MFYDPIWDKQHEECGVLGIYDKHLDIPRYVYWGLFALQHRGQESGGIALTDGQDIHTYRGMGLISTVFANGVPEEEGGPVVSVTSAIRRPVPTTRAISTFGCLYAHGTVGFGS